MRLSIIPSHGSENSHTGQRSTPNEKKFTFSSPFHQITKDKSAIGNDLLGQRDKKIGIHITGPEVLLPLINRSEEVKTLLQNTESGTSIYQQLQKVHLPYPTEWKTLENTLFEQERDQIKDREWLKELHSIIFPRSPRLWCHFSECVGARDVQIDEVNDVNPITESVEIRSSDSLLESQLPTFEFLKQVPSAYRTPVEQMNKISIDDCHSMESESNTDSIAEQSNDLKGQEVRHISDQSSDSFLGLRIRLNSQMGLSYNQGNISPLNIGASTEHGSAMQTKSNTFSGQSPSRAIPFKRQRRLSSLFLTSPFEESKHSQPSSAPIDIPAKSIHNRQRSASEKGENEMFGNDTVLHHLSRQFHQRDLSSGKTEPTSFLLNRNPVWQPLLPPEEVKNPNSKNENRKRANLNGLLPDGRTRHPSAGSGEMKASLATFRKENQTEELSSGTSSPTSVELSPSASMQVEFDHSANSLRWPSNEILPISPITDASDRSMPQTPGENHASLSGMTSFKPMEKGQDDRHFQSSFASFSDPLNTNLRSPKVSGFVSQATNKTSPSTVIFPVPPCPQFSRANELTKALDAIPHQTIDVHEGKEEEEKKEEKRSLWEAYSSLKATIGIEGINQMKTFIQKAGERDYTRDEELLRLIASNCFGLVDMDLAIENGGKILCKDFHLDQEERLKAERKMKDQPWYLVQFNLLSSSSNSFHHQQDQILQQSDQDHEVRVQTYYEDVEAYAKRFFAFDMLLSTIWNVDCTIMHTIRQKCGPVGHFDLKRQYTQTKKMKNTYLTKATY